MPTSTLTPPTLDSPTFIKESSGNQNQSIGKAEVIDSCSDANTVMEVHTTDITVAYERTKGRVQESLTAAVQPQRRMKKVMTIDHLAANTCQP